MIVLEGNLDPFFGARKRVRLGANALSGILGFFLLGFNLPDASMNLSKLRVTLCRARLRGRFLATVTNLSPRFSPLRI